MRFRRQFARGKQLWLEKSKTTAENVCMHTERLQTNQIQTAADLLRAGELVAFPTETVYGLGANALDPSAIDKIFLAKGRPSDNPLIVHIWDRSQLPLVVRDVPPIALDWMNAFWPGALTIVLPKNSAIPDNVTAGLDTVAVRMPSHPITRELLQRANVPIAAPSANRSGRPSATTWQAVAEDLTGRIAGILCGDSSEIGIESTVADPNLTPPRILRLGGISLQQLQRITPTTIGPVTGVRQTKENIGDQECSEVVNSPGLKYRHYQPRAQVHLIDMSVTPTSDSAISNSAFIGLAPAHALERYASTKICTNVEEYAASVFEYFREVDRLGIPHIDCQSVDEEGVGAALMDRLRRAAASHES